MKKLSYFLFVCLLVLTSCSSGNNQNTKDTLKVATEKDISTLNYQKTASTLDMEQISQFMEGLLAFDEQGEVIPAGATKWDISPDGLVYRFSLRKDAKWEDGTAVTAADYLFAWQEIVAHKTSAFAYTLFPIKNAEKIYQGALAADQLGVTALDDYTLEIILEKPYLSFIYSLATATMFPIKQTFYESVDREMFGTSKETILSNGAYNISEYEAASNLFLEKSSTYWDKKNVHIPKVEVYVVKEAATRSVLFNEGNLDIMKISTDFIEKYQHTDYQMLTKQTPKITYLYLSGNTLQENQNLQNKHLRQAIITAIDRNLITQNILKDGSIPLDRLVPCKYAYVEQQDYCDLTATNLTYTYNLEEAKSYFAQAQNELESKDITIEIAYQELDDNAKILENIKFQLETNLSGLHVNLIAYPSSAYAATLRKNGTASAVQTWSGSFPNPEVYLQILEETSSFNFAKYQDDNFQNLYVEAMSTLDKKEQFLLYGAAENQAMQAYMVAPLYQNGVTYLLGKDITTLEYNMTLPNIHYKNMQFA